MTEHVSNNKPKEKKKSLVNIDKINVTKNGTQDSDACKTVSTKIYFTSEMDFSFLIVCDGYALSD